MGVKTFSPDPERASPLKRIIARMVDLMVAWALTLVVPPAGVLGGILYLAVADSFQNGQSLGKMAFGLEVHGGNGHPCTLKDSIYRNLPFSLGLIFAVIPVIGWILLIFAIIPILFIELWLVIVDDKGMRLGDRISDTLVVERIP